MSRIGRIAGGMVVGLGALAVYGYATWRPRNLEYLYRGRRLLFAHRGASAEAPANTIAAFRRAMQVGADGVELDVHLTRDRQVVVIHDESVAAVTGQGGRVREMTLAEIQALDAGSYFGPAFRGERIPTLGQVLEAVGPQAIVNVELKGTGVAGDGLEREVVRLVRQRGMAAQVIFSSFNPFHLWRARRLAPEIPRAMLHSSDTPAYVRQLWLLPLVHPDALHPDHGMVDGAYMKRARSWGVRVNAWTVDDPAEARRLLALGVDGLIANDPRRLREALRGDGWLDPPM